MQWFQYVQRICVENYYVLYYNHLFVIIFGK